MAPEVVRVICTRKSNECRVADLLLEARPIINHHLHLLACGERNKNKIKKTAASWLLENCLERALLHLAR